MNSTAFILIVSFINLVLWVLVFVLLRRQFSPKKVLDNIKDEVDKLLIVMNQETDRDLTLLEAKLSEIHESLKYADYVLNKLKAEETISDLDYSEKINMVQEKPAVTVSISEEARTGKKTYADEAVAWEQSVTLSPTAFEQAAAPHVAAVATAKPVVPVVEPEPETVPQPAFQSASASKTEEGMAKVNRQQVIDLWRMGQSVAEISRRLDCDMTTVQMIIDMFS